ncbi:MAG: hypothetical protein KDD44_03290 [Bdellovibrionales bacterium]|nr:hypothetical protein [Bdellovibrionales bacterium]
MTLRKSRFLVVLSLAGWLLIGALVAHAQPLELGEEYEGYAVGGPRASAPPPPQAEQQSTLGFILLYLPNRLLDAIDIFRVDAGVGVSVGAVARVTRYGQVGYRSVSPFSLRAGLRGRKFPMFIEHSSEFGVGPGFLQSSDREVTPAEIGIGADAVLVGAYVGVSLDEAGDFLAGLVGFDPKGDDLQ